MELSKSLLVLSTEQHLSQHQMDILKAQTEPLAAELGMALAVLPGGIKAEVHSDIGALVEAIQGQTQAITALAESNMMLIDAMSQGEDDIDPDAEPLTYMDGSPVR